MSRAATTTWLPFRRLRCQKWGGTAVAVPFDAQRLHDSPTEADSRERTIERDQHRPMNSVGRVSVRAFWGLASWLLPLIVVFLLTPRLLHLLGPERFGILMVLLVTPVIASQIDFGLALSAVRRLAADLNKGRSMDAASSSPTLWLSA